MTRKLALTVICVLVAGALSAQTLDEIVAGTPQRRAAAPTSSSRATAPAVRTARPSQVWTAPANSAVTVTAVPSPASAAATRMSGTWTT